jgi:hypothetical protein
MFVWSVSLVLVVAVGVLLGEGSSYYLLFIVVREIAQRKKKLPIQINNQKGDSSDKALA